MSKLTFSRCATKIHFFCMLCKNRTISGPYWPAGAVKYIDRKGPIVWESGAEFRVALPSPGKIVILVGFLPDLGALRPRTTPKYHQIDIGRMGKDHQVGFQDPSPCLANFTWFRLLVSNLSLLSVRCALSLSSLGRGPCVRAKRQTGQERDSQAMETDKRRHYPLQGSKLLTFNTTPCRFSQFPELSFFCSWFRTHSSARTTVSRSSVRVHDTVLILESKRAYCMDHASRFVSLWTKSRLCPLRVVTEWKVENHWARHSTVSRDGELCASGGRLESSQPVELGISFFCVWMIEKVILCSL